MDPVTHTLLGAAIGEAVFRPRLGRRAVVASAWAANLPDVDAIVHLSLDPGAIVLRRSFGHSLLLAPLWIAGLAFLFKRRWADVSWRDLLAVVALNHAGHLLFDLINSFGVQLLWPASLARPELAIVFIVDLALTGILAAPHLLRLSPRLKPFLGRAARLSLCAAAVYLIVCFAAHRRAAGILARQGGPAPEFSYVFPEPLGPRRWRGVRKEGYLWRVFLIDALRGSAEERGRILDWADDPAARAARASPFGRRLESFFKAPVWEVEPRPGGGGIASVYDLRFAPLTLARGRSFAYSFEVEADGSAIPREAKIW